jgi:ATP-dependent DNA helicase RecG
MISPAPVTATLTGSLTTPVQYLKGVGPQRAELLAKMGIRTVADLLTAFPREHQDRRIVPLRSVLIGQKATIKGTVQFAEIRQIGRQLGQARAVLKDQSGAVAAVWFKRLSYKYDVFAGVRKLLEEGQTIVCFGTPTAAKDGIEFRVEDAERFDPEKHGQQEDHRIVPVYPLTEGLNEKWMRDTITIQVKQHAHVLPDPVPAALIDREKLLPLPQAVRLYHSPTNWVERDQARERLAFDEFFFLELALAMNRQNREHDVKGFTFTPRKNLLTPFKNQLGYDFTKAQTRVINEIFRDMSREIPMNRLLQGDVGSGKTVVALSAVLLAIENEKQAVFLAPTEILAEQHAIGVARLFAKIPVKWALLTGSTPKPERKKILAGLASGDIQFLIGTHAVLQDDVKFARLGFAVIDEQHRFGVRQRARLLAKSKEQSWEATHPDVLIMTATPIPRTLALTLYGDLDVSVIDELPPGRQPIQTSLALEQHALKRAADAMARGHQVYVVFPLIDESEGKAARAAKKEFEILQNRFPGKKVALLHGQMKNDEKKKAMEAFRSGEASMLVATPVIEVGIDVPNATLMIVMNPEYFGLAQLHQLRGRVGRGSAPSECLLVVQETQEALHERLTAFCAIGDGFKLAEEDLKLRGPGEFLGEAQHGLPFFRVGNLALDGLLLGRSREAARALVQGEIALTMKEFASLNKALISRFGHKLQLSNVG